MLAAQGAAASRCDDLLRSMGRNPEARAETPPVPGADFPDCRPGQTGLFVYDPEAARDAVEVADTAELVGAWRNDDVYLVVAGLFIPYFEVLEVAAGEAPNQVEMRQYIVRPRDIALDMAAGPAAPLVDVEKGGRTPLFGEMTSQRFPCLVHALDDRQSEARIGAPLGDLFAAVAEALSLQERRDAQIAEARSLAADDTAGKDRVQQDMLKVLDKMRGLQDTPAMQALAREVASKAPFGCPKPF
jgi:hypothetical protein